MRLEPCSPIAGSICRLKPSVASCRAHTKEQINMPRIPYKPIDIAKPKDIVDAIRLRRGGNLLNLDRMLLHSPAFAKGWNALLLEVRTGLALSPKLREIAMCVVAVLNGADYEFHHHAPELIKAGGTSAQVAALRHPELSYHDTVLYNAAERAAIQLTIEMTRNMEVSDATFSAIRTALSNEQ